MRSNYILKEKKKEQIILFIEEESIKLYAGYLMIIPALHIYLIRVKQMIIIYLL